jgi:hypothetical protein
MPSPLRAVALASALLAARALLDGDAGASPPITRGVPEHGAARLLYGERLDPNREPAVVLALLPGLGPKRAEALVEARPLCSLADVDRVDGLGPVTLRTLGDHLAFADRPRGCEHELQVLNH